MAGDPKAISAGNHQYQLQSGEGLFQLLHRSQGDEGVHVVQIKEIGISGILPTSPPFPSLYCHCIWVSGSELNVSGGLHKMLPGAGVD